ncbi:MAG: biotin transporter BioY [Aquamicrobium sp.]|nr:biotin transporter BioY [Aquamicrobium sp.]
MSATSTFLTGGTSRETAIRHAVAVALGVGFLIAASKIRVPMWPVPMTMQTFAVLIVGGVCSLRMSATILVAWLSLGLLGFSVFTGEAAGAAYLAGPTAGYLAGFVAAALLVGAVSRRSNAGSPRSMVLSLALGCVAIYTCGLLWMAWLFGASQSASWILWNGMIVFVPGEILKLAAAAAILVAMRTRSDRQTKAK